MANRKKKVLKGLSARVAGTVLAVSMALCAQGASAAVALHAVSELDEARSDLPDNPSTYARANSVTGNPQDVLHLVGNAEIRRGGSALKADSITYTQATDEVEARGNVLLYKNSATFTGEQASYRIDAQSGEMPDVDYVFATRGLRGCADKAEFVDGSHVAMQNARITSCPKNSNSWWVDLDQLDLDEGEEAVIGRWASLHLGGVPVLGFPWFDFPIGQSRKSGILTPSLSMSTGKGMQLAIPYYWNIAPNYDYTIVPNIMSKRGVMLENEFRYLQENFSGKINYNWLYHDRERDETRYSMHMEHRYHRGGFYAGMNYNKVSDSDFIDDFSGTIRESSENVLNQDFWMGYGQDFWTLNARVNKNQTLEDHGYWKPYERIPQITLDAYKGNVYGVEYKGKVEATRFHHPNKDRPNGDRLVVDQVAGYPLRGSWWFMEPKARIIGTWYNMDEARARMGDVVLDRHASRILPVMSFDTGLIFDRDASWFGRAAEQTLEPRLFYAYIPYKDQSRMPVFDTTLSDLNIAQLFEENVFSGYDRVSEANQLTAAVTSRYLDSVTGIEWFRGTLGQRFYFSNQKVGLYDIYSGNIQGDRTNAKSDLLGSVGVRFTRSLTADATMQYSSSEKKVTRALAGFRWNPKLSSTVSLYYRYNYAPGDFYNNIKQVDLGFQWPITGNLYGVGRWNYSFHSKHAIEALGGFEYHGDCWTLRAVLQRYVTSTDKYDNNFFIQLELNGLGSIGTNPISELRSGIPGYQNATPTPNATGRYEYYE